jgi:hypothetical protein
MTINWRREWILSYESPWSIIEKIKSANLVSTRQFLQAFGTERAQKNKVGFLSKQLRELFHLEGLNHILLNETLSYSLFEHNKKFIKRITHPLPTYIKRKDLLRNSLTYCKQCLNQGHHSLFASIFNSLQMSFHLDKLEEVCFHCHKQIPYSIGLIKRRGEPFPPICPYAYAYVFWKESFYNINPFYHDVAPIKRKNLKRLTLPFEQHSEVVDELIRNITNDISNHNQVNLMLGHIHWRDVSENIDSMLWLLGHTVWNIARDHFFEWLNLAAEFAEKHIRPTIQFDKFDLQGSIFSFVRTNESIEFHLTREKLQVLDKLICPNHDKRYKEFIEDEISHLPIRLAMQPGFEEERHLLIKYLAGLKIFSLIR